MTPDRTVSGLCPEPFNACVHRAALSAVVSEIELQSCIDTTANLLCLQLFLSFVNYKLQLIRRVCVLTHSTGVQSLEPVHGSNPNDFLSDFRHCYRSRYCYLHTNDPALRHSLLGCRKLTMILHWYPTPYQWPLIHQTSDDHHLLSKEAEPKQMKHKNWNP